MITDVIGAEKSLFKLENSYVRRAGEIATRGPILGQTQASLSPASTYYSYATQCEFHSEFGSIVCQNVVATSATTTTLGHNLVAAPLQGSAQAGVQEPDYSWTVVSQSTGGYYVPSNATGTFVLLDEIVSMTKGANEIYMGGSLGRVYKWAGATAVMASGTAVATSGVSLSSTTATPSNIVTFGTAINVTATMEPGSYLMIDDVGENNVVSNKNVAYRITNIDGQNVELEYPLYVTGAMTNKAWVSTPVALVASESGVWNGSDEYPRIFGPVAYHQGRLFVAGPSNYRTDYNTVYDFSSIQWSHNAGTTTSSTSNHAHVDKWGAGAWQPIFPGIGGAIMGMVSMGSELVIIKTHAIFALSGEVADDGGNQNLNASVRLVQDGPGAQGFRAWKLTKAGLVIAGQDGLYLYDGQQVKSLTDGRIQRWWEGNFRQYRFAMTAFDDKVIISPWRPRASSSSWVSLVWDLEKDYFHTIRTDNLVACGMSTFTSDDTWSGDIGFEQYQYASATNMLWNCYSNLNHKATGSLSNLGDATTDRIDQAVNQRVGFEIISQNIPLGEDQVSEGRVNNVLLACVTGETNQSNIAVYVENGMSQGRQVSGTDYEEQGTEYQTEIGISSTADAEDRVHRIPFDGNVPAAGTRVRIKHDHASGYGNSLRVFAIGVDFVPTNVVS